MPLHFSLEDFFKLIQHFRMPIVNRLKTGQPLVVLQLRYNRLYAYSCHNINYPKAILQRDPYANLCILHRDMFLQYLSADTSFILLNPDIERLTASVRELQL